jgi:hypothetical protein
VTARDFSHGLEELAGTVVPLRPRDPDPSLAIVAGVCAAAGITVQQLRDAAQGSLADELEALAPYGRYVRLADEAAQVLAAIRSQAPGGREPGPLCGRLGELADAIRAMAGEELAVARILDAGRAAERAAASPVVRLHAASDATPGGAE